MPELNNSQHAAKIHLNPDLFTAGISIQHNRVEAGLFSPDNKLLIYKENTISSDDDPIPTSVGLLKAIIPEKNIASLLSIGVSFPGIIEDNKQYIKSSTHFPEFEDRPVGEEIKLSLNLDIPVFVERNAVCDLIYLVFNRKITNDTIVLSLKTGVSAAIYIDGNILHGRSGNLGEFGHLTNFGGKIACVCGKTGCIETEIGEIAWSEKYTTLLRSLSKSKNHNPFPDSFHSAIKKSLPDAIEILKESINVLYPHLGHLSLLFSPATLAFATNLPPSCSIIFATAINDICKKQNITHQSELLLTDKLSTVGGAAHLGLLRLCDTPYYKL